MVCSTDPLRSGSESLGKSQAVPIFILTSDRMHELYQHYVYWPYSHCWVQHPQLKEERFNWLMASNGLSTWVADSQMEINGGRDGGGRLLVLQLSEVE